MLPAADCHAGCCVCLAAVSLSVCRLVWCDVQGDVVAVEVLAAPVTVDAAAGGVPSVPAKGRVVGIIRRNWRPLCGSLEPADGAFARCACLVVAPRFVVRNRAVRVPVCVLRSEGAKRCSAQ